MRIGEPAQQPPETALRGGPAARPAPVHCARSSATRPRSEHMAASDAQAPDTVVLIHGLWLTAASWEHWVERYEARGFTVVAESWPGMDGDLDRAARRSVRPERPRDRRDRRPLRRHRRGLDRPPIIMGHSFGGAFTQILLDRGLGAAGVAIDAAAVKGIYRLPLSALRSAWPALKNPANRHRTTMLYAGGVPLRVHQHAHRGGVGRGLRALCRARPGPRALPGGARELQPARPDARRLQERRPRTAAPDRRRRRPHGARRCRQVDRQALRQVRPRSPSTRSSPIARTTRSARTAGRRSPTTRSSGR